MRNTKTFFCVFVLAVMLLSGAIYFASYRKASVSPATCTLTLFLPNERNVAGIPDRFSKQAFMQEISGKPVKTIDLTDDHATNQRKLAAVRAAAKKLRESHDTSTVIRVVYSTQATYQELVNLVDMLQVDKQKRYAIIDNDIYIIGSPMSSF